MIFSNRNTYYRNVCYDFEFVNTTQTDDKKEFVSKNANKLRASLFFYSKNPFLEGKSRNYMIFKECIPEKS